MPPKLFDFLSQVVASEIAQKKIGLKPSRSQPGGAGPTVDRDSRAGNEAGCAHFGDLRVPIRILRARPDFGLGIRAWLTSATSQDACLCGLCEIGVMEVVAIQGRDGKRMNQQSGVLAREIADNRIRNGTGGLFIPDLRRGWVYPNDREGAERF